MPQPQPGAVGPHGGTARTAARADARTAARAAEPQHGYRPQQHQQMMAYHQQQMHMQQQARQMQMPAAPQQQQMMMMMQAAQAHCPPGMTPLWYAPPMTPQPMQPPHALPVPTPPQSGFAAAVRKAGGQLFPYSELPGGNDDDAEADAVAQAPKLDTRAAASTPAPEGRGGPQTQMGPAPPTQPTPPLAPEDDDEPSGPDFFLAAVVLERHQMGLATWASHQKQNVSVNGGPA